MKNLYSIILSIFVTGCSAVGIGNYEEPNFKVMLEEKNFQVRQYSNILVAQATASGTYKESSGQNFKRLAGYIFGDNIANEKMQMTTPVLQEQQSEKMQMTTPVFQQKEDTNWTMTFVLPSKYTMDTVPQPIDKSVTVKVLPKIKVATLKYSGRINEDNISKHTRLLEEWVNEKDFNAVAAAYSAAYDPPWTVPMLRRNEIHIPIE